MRIRPLRHLLPAALAATVLAVPAHAQEPAGSVVVRDPATGEMRAPTPAELRALRATPAPGTAQAGPQQAQPVVRQDGTRALKLGEGDMVYSVAKRAADGTIKQHCVSGEQAAEQAVQAPAQPKEHGHEHQ